MFKQLSVTDAQAKISQSAFILLDVRDMASYLAGHLPGAKLFTPENFKQILQQTDKQQPVLVYCYHGYSSQRVAEFLGLEGFTTVYNLVGGFTAWQQTYPHAIEYGEKL